MRLQSIGIACALTFLATPANSQRVLATRLGEVGSEFGRPIAAAGDVNRDGVDDVLAVSPEFTSQGQRTPSLFVLSGIDLSPIRVITGPRDEDWGFAIDGGQDFDGDQVPDILVGVPGRVRNSFRVGAVELHSGASGALLATYSPAGPTSRGHAVAALPDLDRDGVPDFAVSDVGAGTIHMVSGRTRILFRTGSLMQIQGVQSSPTLQLRVAGDVDRDGTVDLIWGYAVQGNGTAAVVSGASGARLLTMTGTDPTRLGLGQAVTGCGDLDGDGHADFAISAPRSRRNGSYIGLVEVRSGRTGALLHEIGPALPGNESFGAGLTVVGDWNGDGTRDLAIAVQAAWLRHRSAVAIHSGRDGGQIAVFDAVAPTDYLGEAMTGLGDVDRDGLSDLAIGTPLDSTFLLRQGSVRVLSGQILAQSMPVGQACGGGPTLPSLLASRPILGSSFTLLGRNVHALGVVLFGRPANLPFNLGVPGCDLHIHPEVLIELLRITSAQDWSVLVPLPDFAPLVGVELTLQATYAPTTGPLGADISNGVRLRLGR